MSDEKPIDIAVALRWDGAAAPKVTAKGRGELASRIAQKARECGVPITDDPDLVEVLAQVRLGEQIPETLFVAVAEVIAFAYGLRSELPPHVATNARSDEVDGGN